MVDNLKEPRESEFDNSSEISIDEYGRKLQRIHSRYLPGYNVLLRYLDRKYGEGNFSIEVRIP